MSEVVAWNGSEPHLTSASISVDEVGVLTMSLSYVCKDDEMAKEVLAYEVEDVEFGVPLARFVSSSADRLEAGMWNVGIEIAGILSEDLIGEYKLYKVSTVANREPIASHPNFNTFAGKIGNPINGAVFDETGFVRFKPYLTAGDEHTNSGDLQTVANGETIKNRKAGVTDYFMPIIHFEETKLVLEGDLRGNIEYLALVDPATPSTPLKPTYPNRSWLLTQGEPEWVGKEVYKLIRKWSLSGPRGWDKDVYPKE